jgi:uncharacterized membrane protein YfcA
MDSAENIPTKPENFLENPDLLSFEDLGIQQVTGCILIFLSSMLCNSVGIGCGSIIVMILLYLFNMQGSKALALAQVSLFGGSIIATSLKLSMRHPIKVCWPLIDFKLCALASPMLMLGASNGSQLAQVFPTWSVLGALSVLVWVVTVLTLFKAIQMYKDESELKKGYKRLTIEDIRDQSFPENLNLSYMMIIFSYLILLVYSSGKRLLVQGEVLGNCFLEFLLLSGIYHLLSLLLTIFYSKSLLNEVKDQFNYSTQIYSTKSNIIKITILAYLTGILSGTLGVGGTLILNPIFLMFGMNAEVSTASCNLMILTVSSSSALNFLLSGFVGVFNGILVLVLSLAGSCAGVFLLKKWIEKSHRLSIIAFLLFIVFALVSVLIPVELIQIVMTLVDQGRFSFEFQKFC